MTGLPSDVAPPVENPVPAHDEAPVELQVRLTDAPLVIVADDDPLTSNDAVTPPPPPPTTPMVIKIKGIFSTNADPTFSTPTVVTVLQLFVMSGIYRGMKKDPGEAAHMWNAARQMLAEAKSRHDMQKPKAAIFNSRMTAVRRNRKPWRQTPYGWSGTGTPN